MFTSTFLQNNPSGNATYSAGDFNGIVKGVDMNFLYDYDRMVMLGIRTAENQDSNASYDNRDSNTYWMVSRYEIGIGMMRTIFQHKKVL